MESWLQNVVDAMRAALSHEFKVAIPAYDEKPRTKWIFDYSVQNTIMVSRTFFTQDVNEAFEELEEGNEDALKVCLPAEAPQAAAHPMSISVLTLHVLHLSAPITTKHHAAVICCPTIADCNSLVTACHVVPFCQLLAKLWLGLTGLTLKAGSCVVTAD